jgi:large subunit ribosomal protein L15
MPSRTRKFRGSRTHGRGIKAGRGAGKQGGVGNAGLHKHKFKSMLLYAPDHFGRHGFVRGGAPRERPTAINVGELDLWVARLEAAGALTREGEHLIANLSSVGIDRLLGGGATRRHWRVYVAHASGHAREKVEVLESAPGGAASEEGAEGDTA